MSYRKLLGITLQQIQGNGSNIAVGDVVFEDTKNGENVFIVTRNPVHREEWHFIPVVSHTGNRPFFESYEKLVHHMACHMEVYAIYRPSIGGNGITRRVMDSIVKGMIRFNDHVRWYL